MTYSQLVTGGQSNICRNPSVTHSLMQSFRIIAMGDGSMEDRVRVEGVLEFDARYRSGVGSEGGELPEPKLQEIF